LGNQNFNELRQQQMSNQFFGAPHWSSTINFHMKCSGLLSSLLKKQKAQDVIGLLFFGVRKTKKPNERHHPQVALSN
jgi:hypothetical protein